MPGLEALQHGEVLAQRFELTADRSGAVEDAHAELGRHRALPAADEQLHAELGFELVHVPGDVRLHRVQPVGGGGEGTLFGDREQGFELS